MQLQRCAEEWLTAYDRDVNGFAYANEALRHIEGREDEGYLQLQKDSNRFTRNRLLAAFLLIADYERKEKGLTYDDVRSQTTYQAEKSAQNWNLFWNITEQGDFESKLFPIAPWDQDESFHAVPIQASFEKFRLDPPPFLNLRISDLRLKTDNQVVDVDVEKLVLNGVHVDKGSLLTFGTTDPNIYFDFSDVLENQDPEKPMTLLFRLSYYIGKHEFPVN